jgi:hypothetical protein
VDFYLTCTAQRPMPLDANKSAWRHPDAQFVREDLGSLSSGGSYDVYFCPHCNTTIDVELPD